MNLLIAVPSYFKGKKIQIIKAFRFQKRIAFKIERKKCFCSIPPWIYCTFSGGFYLKQRASVDANNYYRFRGWGNSLIMQGGFLFILDLTATFAAYQAPQE